MKRIVLTLMAVAVSLCSMAQTDVGGQVRFDRMVYDFGDVIEGSGPVSCSFKIVNISQKELNVNSVVSSCGCTGVRWTRGGIAPGAEGRIDVTYSNDEGAYPFDKTLTVYVSSLRKPVVLHVRGVVRDRKRPLSESFPVHYGGLALRGSAIKVGNLSQGEVKSGEISVANMSDKPISVEFRNLSDGLELRCVDRSIPPGKLSTLVYTVTSDRSRWGENWYYATPVVNGEVRHSSGRERKVRSALGARTVVTDGNPELEEGCTVLGFTAVTKENFSAMTKSQLGQAAAVEFKETTLSYGKVRAGTRSVLTFEFSNPGKSPLEIYKVDTQSRKLRCIDKPRSLTPAASGKLQFELDTAGMTPGESLFVVNLYTNSPSNPVISLYITGIVE